MEIQDDTEALRKLFAELEPESALALVANPKAALKAMNVPVSAESRVDIKNRADRVTSSNLTGHRRRGCAASSSSSSTTATATPTSSSPPAERHHSTASTSSCGRSARMRSSVK